MLATWDLYDISCDCALLHGVKLRGRVRKFSVENGITCLVENASDKENVVRFAVPAGESVEAITHFISTLVPEAVITPSLQNVANPILSKLAVNDPSRYEI